MDAWVHWKLWSATSRLTPELYASARVLRADILGNAMWTHWIQFMTNSDFSLPKLPGVGYKSKHFNQLSDDPGTVGWLEIHAENYLGAGGRPKAQLETLRNEFPISCHGVGLSIGAESSLDEVHLNRLGQLIRWLEPSAFSEHLAWSTHEGHYLNDLLPLPYNSETLERVCDHIEQVQEALGRAMMLENPSTYLEFEESEMEEAEFIRSIANKTGCKLLLDVNNVFVSAKNHGWEPRSYIDAFPLDLVEEIHLGGHDEDADDDGDLLLIDSHGREVADPVWELFDYVLSKTGPLPTLIEWDNDVPDWPVLKEEAERASVLLQKFEPSALDGRQAA